MLEAQGKREREIRRIRNIGIIAHVDAGKTTTTERLLKISGKIHSIGEVHEGNATMDFLPAEQKRGITIQSAATTIFWKEHQINLIDTPGHVDFTAEVERSLRVLDGAIVVLDGKKGVEAQTETVWRQASKYKIPRLIFVNKMDGVDNDDAFDRCVNDINSKFKTEVVPIQFPIGHGKDLKGIVDVIEEKAYYFEPKDEAENYKISEIPNELVERKNLYRHNLIEKIIKYGDEEIVLNYLSGEIPTKEEIKKLLRVATLTGENFPVLCGSAYKHVGIKLTLDAIVDYLPSPDDSKEIIAFSSKDKENRVKINWNDKSIPCLALAFKTTIDSYNNKLTFVRVYAGKLTSNSYIYNVNKKEVERVGRLVRIHANIKEDIKEVLAGDIAAIIGLSKTITGETLGDEKNSLLLESIKFAETVITQAIEPETGKDRDRMKNVLERLRIQDPSFNYWMDEETQQMIIAGMGALHLEICVEELTKKYELGVKVKKQEVSYRESITKKTDSIVSEYKKQSGGSGSYAKIFVTFEPTTEEEEEEFVFVDAIKGGVIPKNFIKAVEEGMREALFTGLLAGYPTIGVKVTLTDGNTHSVDSKDSDFKEAAILAFRGSGSEERKEKIEKFGIILREPIMDLEVIVPRDYMSKITAGLSAKRVSIEKIEDREEEVIVKGKAPLREMLSYSDSLRKQTQGRGTYSMIFSHYQEVPKSDTEDIIKSKLLNSKSNSKIRK